MPKVLKVSFPEKCTGCELCVFEVQRQLNKIGLDGSPIRIFKNKEERVLLGDVVFTVDLDPKVNKNDLEKIKGICPTGVFTIEEVGKEQQEQLLE